MFVKRKSNRNVYKYVLWFVVILSIFLLNRFAINQATIRLPIIDNIRYGYFLFQKWFLVVIAFCVFGFSLFKRRKLFNLKLLKTFLLPSVFIAAALLIARFGSFSHWFYHDDFGIVGYHFFFLDTPNLQGMSCCSPGYYSLGLMQLVIRWFGHVFEAYKATGLFVHFLAGVAIYALANRIQKNKTVSLLAALFFVTTTTNFYQTISALEFMGDSFSLLLFILSIYTLVSGYWSSSVIFGAAAMEFGLSRTHFISLPLLIIMWLFVPKINRWKPQWILTSLAFIILPLTYLGLVGHVTGPSGSGLEWNPVFVYASVLFGVVVPHNIIFPVVKYLRLLTGNSPYIVPFLGIAVIAGLLLLGAFIVYKKRHVAKTFLLGLVILFVSIIMPVLRGSRITSNFEGLTTQYMSEVPALSTGYGLFPAFGLVLIIIAIGQIMRPKIFKIALISIIVFNTFSYIKLDSNFAKLYANHERAINKQMESILPIDNQVKIVFVPDRSKLYLSLLRYIEVFRAKETIIITSNPEQFMETVNKYKPTKDHFFYLTLNENTFQIHDWSERLRAYPINKLEGGLKTLDEDPNQKFLWAR